MVAPAYSALLTPMDGGNAIRLPGANSAYIHVGRMSAARPEGSALGVLSDNLLILADYAIAYPPYILLLQHPRQGGGAMYLGCCYILFSIYYRSLQLPSPLAGEGPGERGKK